MPKGTKVSRCVDKVEKQGKDKVAAIKICQTSTGQSYKTGKRSKKKVKESMDKKCIIDFIKNINNNDFAAANESLQKVVDAKIKTRIRNYNESTKDSEKDTENQ